MKKVIMVTLIIVGAMACNSQRDVDKEIKDKITSFYTYSEVNDYQPISYSKMDTVVNTSTFKTGVLIHTFRARSNNGQLRQYSDTFNIAIFDGGVTAIPRGYD